MPLQKIQFKPGIVRDLTAYTTEGGWFDGNLVRFRLGFPQSVGGWQRFSSYTYLGVARSLMGWSTLAGQYYIGVGTSVKFYIESGGQYYDVTPIRRTVSLTASSSTASTGGPFIATSGSPLINVYDVGHGCTSGDYVTFSGATSLGGNLTATVLNKEYSITKVIDGDNYQITASVNAAAGDTGHGGTVTTNYQINTGLDDAVSGAGWGAGIWGGGTAFFGGSGSIVTTGTSGTGSTATVTFAAQTTAPPVGSKVVLRGITPTGYNGIYTITAATTSSVSFASTTVGSQTVAGTVGVFTSSVPARGWGSSVAIDSGNTLRLWSQDTWGEDLVFSVHNGGIYYWQSINGTASQLPPTTDPATRAVSIASLSTDTTCPTSATQIIVSDRDRHLIAFGANNYLNSSNAVVSNQDAMLIRWSDQEDFTTWYPTATNSAGDLRLGTGSQIIRAVETKREILVFTDIALYSMQFIGPPYTYGIQQVSSNTTTIGFNAFAVVEDNVIWMGLNKFYIYAGSTDEVMCPVKGYVFDNLNHAQSDKIFAAVNSEFNEITWFYPSSNATENDSYVTYNYADKAWTYGSLARTAWVDRGVLDYPVAAGTDGYLYNHEIGTDDGSQNPPVAISSYIESSPFDIGEGDQFSFIKRIIPDITFVNSTDSPTASMTLKMQNFPGSNYSQSKASSVTQSATVPVEQFTEQVFVRLRGRQATFRLESNKVGTRWVMGSPRLDLQPDGRR